MGLDCSYKRPNIIAEIELNYIRQIKVLKEFIILVNTLSETFEALRNRKKEILPAEQVQRIKIKKRK